MASASPDRVVSSKGLVLGVDLGTTTVKACLVSSEGGSAVSSLSRETKATIASDLGSLGSEQDAHKICTALQFCLSQLPKEQLARVTRVAVSGQMHGVVLWRRESGWKRNAFGRFDVDVVSALYTWQDGRCSASFLESLPRPRSHLRLSSGHGCATLFWLLRHRSRELLLERFDRAGAVQDLVVAMLCGLDRPVMSTQTAASWGYFDTVDGQWNTDLLREAGFPVDLLPAVVEPGAVAGCLEHPWYGIPAGTPVHAALGDMQCSALSVGAGEGDAVLNMSTSAQLSFLLEPSFVPRTSDETGGALEAFPYFGGRYLAVAASLNGGNVLAIFVRMLQQWMHQLGTGIPESAIWERLLAAGADERSATSASAQSADATTPPPPDLVVTPTVFGERHMPGARGSVSGIGPQSALSLGAVLRALCQGLARNLHAMMPREMLERAGVRRIVGTGKALTRNACLKQAVHDVYGIPLELGGKGDAALGAALAVLAHAERGHATGT
ncbi:sedoheptulokinase-like isoform X1 [Dermacentor andersoni]|uniref:sedoheptulokinase-like isoform X1 n=1 Tax=Dermacentor andersoni TaxID=34620 RepID=UPI003B3B1853